MAVQVGDRYRNTSGTTLLGLFPPDAEAVVRQVDPNDEDTAHFGTLVLEYDVGDGIGAAVGLTEAGLAEDWERVTKRG